jgi:hypothetical protein
MPPYLPKRKSGKIHTKPFFSFTPSDDHLLATKPHLGAREAWSTKLKSDVKLLLNILIP